MTENYDNNIYNEPYCVKDGCLYETVERKGKVTTVRLCDYAPVLKSEITFDDGTEQRKAFEVGAVHSNGTTMPTVTVTADEMSSMKWLIEKWGSLGSYSPANNTLGKIRHAIMSTKADVEFRTVYSQTGWRQIDNRYEFLMPSEDSKFTVELQGKLNAYHWSTPASVDKLFYLTALLENGLLPQRVMLPLLAVTFLSPLEHFLKAASCEPKFITALVGKTGTRKSTTAALMCSFFGNFTASTLPMSFHDTANSILSNIYSLKDVLTCVDDLHPNGLYGDSEMKSTAQNLARFYGDRIGRARLNSKIELQPSRPPTGMCLVTAEYVPEISQSGLARYFIVEMKSDDIDLALMTEYQQLAADGVLAAIMHSYVDWLRETYLCDDEKFAQGLSDTFKKYRTEITAELSARCDNFHTRVPDTLAHLMIGFDFLLAFLNAKEEIGVQDMENYKSSFKNIIVNSSVRNNSIVESENYSYQFCDKLKSLLDSGRCSVNVIGSDHDMNRKGFIGFDDDNFYYLIMNAALSEVVKLSKEMGESFSIGKNSLIQQLVDDGIMVVKGKRNTTTVRVTDDRQMSVAVLDKSKMFPDMEEAKNSGNR